MGRRRKDKAELKANAALKVLRGEQTMVALSAGYNAQPNLVATRKRQANESIVDVFTSGGKKRETERDADSWTRSLRSAS